MFVQTSPCPIHIYSAVAFAILADAVIDAVLPAGIFALCDERLSLPRVGAREFLSGEPSDFPPVFE